MTTENPLRQLYHKAPAKVDTEETIHKLVASVGEADHRTSEVAAAIAQLRQEFQQVLGSRQQGLKRQRGPARPVGNVGVLVQVAQRVRRTENRA